LLLKTRDAPYPIDANKIRKQIIARMNEVPNIPFEKSEFMNWIIEKTVIGTTKR
jgi:hypothetical protein